MRRTLRSPIYADNEQYALGVDFLGCDVLGALVAMSLPPLNAVRTFVVAGRTLNLTAAAAELGVTQSAVTRMVQSLEAELGVKLFRKQGRNIDFTSAGAAYHAEVSEAINHIALATQSVRHAERGGILTISALPTFAVRWLMPRLPRFHELHPDILVNLITGDGEVRFDKDFIDVAIRYGTEPWCGVDATHLLSEEVGVVCAPSLANSSIQSPKDLLDARLLQASSRQNGWKDYFERFNLKLPDNKNIQNFEHFFMLSEAAVNGLGHALVPLLFVSNDLETNRLVLSIDDIYYPTSGYYLLHPQDARNVRKTQLFKVWLLSEASRAGPGCG